MANTAEIQRIELLGDKHAVILPDFAAREELAVAWGQARDRGGIALLRVLSAALGLCTRLGRQAGADYAKHRFDVLAYGGEVYGWLRSKGATPAEVRDAAMPVLVQVVRATFPTDDEVEAAAGN